MSSARRAVALAFGLGLAVAASSARPGLAGAEAPPDEPGERYLICVSAETLLEQQTLADAIGPLAVHRSEDGFAVRVMFCEPATAREEILSVVAKERPSYLLLVGDARAIPPFQVGETASDRPYGDLNGDGYPEVSVGRIPFNEGAVVYEVARRTVAYEARRDGGAGRKQCALVAGEGRFSPEIDGMIERLFNQVVSEAVDPGYDVDLTYANPSSPYCYPPREFADRVVERINEGALVFAYVGHGDVRSVDHLVVEGPDGKKRYPVLDASHVKRLHAQARSPVVVSIACWTGQLDGEERSIGEELLAAPGGPIAFYGSSRISHPVHNALLAIELVRSFFDGVGEVRLGPALDRAERAMVEGPADGTPADPARRQVLLLARAFLGPDEVDREMPRHVDMYNLFGDPALRLARPDDRIAVEAPARAQAGRAISVAGRVPDPALYPGVVLTLEVSRDRSARPDPADGETPLERYARANDKVTATVLASVGADGRFQAQLTLPDGLLSGAYTLKAFAQGERRCAIGARRIEVTADPAFDPFAAEDEERERAPAPAGARRYF